MSHSSSFPTSRRRRAFGLGLAAAVLLLIVALVALQGRSAVLAADAPNNSAVNNSAANALRPVSANGPGMYDDYDPNWVYSGTWYQGEVFPQAYRQTMHFSNDPHARASFSFLGTGFALYRITYTNRGLMEVWVDGAQARFSNNYSDAPAWQAPLVISGFPDGQHTVEFRNTSNRFYMDVDAIQIFRGNFTGPVSTAPAGNGAPPIVGGGGAPPPRAPFTPTDTQTPSQTPSLTVSPSATQTETPTTTPSATFTVTPTDTPSATVSPSLTLSPSVTATASDTPTPSQTSAASPTLTVTETLTETVTVTISPTLTPTVTVTTSSTPAIPSKELVYGGNDLASPNSNLFVIDALAASTPTQITTATGAGYRFPVWSPDRTTIAFIDNTAGGQVVLLDVASGTLTPLPILSIAPVAWDPIRGNRIAYIEKGAPNFISIFDIPLFTSVSLNISAGASQLGWSRISNQITFQQPGTSGVLQSVAAGCVITPPCTPVATAGTVGFINSDPAWSPAGDKLAYVSNQDGQGATGRDLYMFTGGVSMRITNDAAPKSSPAWEPGTNSNRIAYVENGTTIKIVIATPAGASFIVRTATSITSVSWRPDASLLLTLTPSPTNTATSTSAVTATATLTTTTTLTSTITPTQTVGPSPTSSLTPSLTFTPTTTLTPTITFTPTTGATLTTTGSPTLTPTITLTTTITQTVTSSPTTTTSPAQLTTSLTADNYTPAVLPTGGQVVTFTLHVMNSGTVALTNVSGIVQVNGVTLLAPTPAATTAILAPGASVDFRFSYTIMQSDPCVLIVFGSASAINPANPGNPITQTPMLDRPVNVQRTGLVISSQPVVSNPVGATSVTVGQTVTTTTTVQNAGCVPENISARTNKSDTVNPATVASVPVGAVITFTSSHTVTSADITATPPVLTLFYLFDAADPSGRLAPVSNLASNVINLNILTGSTTATATTTGAGVLSVVKSASASSASPGADITFTITVTNTGAVAIPNITLTDNVPSDTLTVKSVSSTVGAATNTGNSVTVAIGTLNAAQAATITITATVNSGVTSPAVITNSASASFPGGATVTSNTVNIPFATGGAVLPVTGYGSSTDGGTLALFGLGLLMVGGVALGFYLKTRAGQQH